MTEWLHFHFSLSCIGEGNGNPPQCSCLENPRDWGAWWAAVYEVHRVGHDWSNLAAAAITGQGKAKLQNGETGWKCQIQITTQQSCRFERGGWRLNRGGCTEKLSPKTSLTLPEHGGGYSCALHGCNHAGGAKKEGHSFYTKNLE